jgi:hypothetical protein
MWDDTSFTKGFNYEKKKKKKNQYKSSRDALPDMDEKTAPYDNVEAESQRRVNHAEIAGVDRSIVSTENEDGKNLSHKQSEGAAPRPPRIGGFRHIYEIRSPTLLHATKKEGDEPESPECCSDALRGLYDMNDTLYVRLNEYKNEIAHYAHTRKWDRYKKVTNDYELVSSSSQEFPSVSAYTPISRSFYKLWEILVEFHGSIFPSDKKPMRAMFLAEGPGGFVEAFATYRRRFFSHMYHRDALHGMTLQSSEKYVPYWSNAECEKYRMRIHRGEDNTGNLYNLRNIAHMVSCVGKMSCDFVTADGGFDFSGNYNTQEETSTELIACETLSALQLIRNNGVFVLKIYDIRTPVTFRLIHMLRCMFRAAYFVKPVTSRPANSEKYVVCVGFHATGLHSPSCTFFPSFRNDIESKTLSFEWASKCDPSVNKSLFPFGTMSAVFLREIVLYNAYYVTRQSAYIHKTISIIRTTDECNRPLVTDFQLLKEQLDKCIRWCQKHSIPLSMQAMRLYKEFMQHGAQQ